ncbi:hypothetical protein B0G38_000817 [Arthrobacter sp. VKM Ac-2550]|nr:hypothetical protein [Arthrobacter sp. VKM Ac-2550]
MKGSTMSSALYGDWNELTGLDVEIKKDGRSVRIGHVGAVTRGADALWLENHGAQMRTLFEKAEGYTAWPLSGSTEMAAR